MHAAVVLGILPTFNSILLAMIDCNQFLGHSSVIIVSEKFQVKLAS